MKKTVNEIREHHLDPTLFRVHKDENIHSDFGMDHSNELVQGGFGLYSTVNTKNNIGPIKSQYFRISLVRAGRASFNIGIETYQPVADSIVFGFPGQVFSLYEKSDDFLAYYMLFTEEFMSASALLQGQKAGFPDVRHEVVQLFSKGNLVCVRGLFKGTNTGAMQGNPPTGNRVEIPFIFTDEFDETGKVKVRYVQFDTGAFNAQLMAAN